MWRAGGVWGGGGGRRRREGGCGRGVGRRWWHGWWGGPGSRGRRGEGPRGCAQRRLPGKNALHVSPTRCARHKKGRDVGETEAHTTTTSRGAFAAVGASTVGAIYIGQQGESPPSGHPPQGVKPTAHHFAVVATKKGMVVCAGGAASAGCGRGEVGAPAAGPTAPQRCPLHSSPPVCMTNSTCQWGNGKWGGRTAAD